MRGDTLEGGDTQVKSIKSDSDGDDHKKVASFCEEKNGGDTAKLATKKFLVASFAVSPPFFVKRSPGFSGINRGVTPSAAAPGVSHPSDASENYRSGEE